VGAGAGRGKKKTTNGTDWLTHRPGTTKKKVGGEVGAPTCKGRRKKLGKLRGKKRGNGAVLRITTQVRNPCQRGGPRVNVKRGVFVIAPGGRPNNTKSKKTNREAKKRRRNNLAHNILLIKRSG